MYIKWSIFNILFKFKIVDTDKIVPKNLFNKISATSIGQLNWPNEGLVQMFLVHDALMAWERLLLSALIGLKSCEFLRPHIPEDKVKTIWQTRNICNFWTGRPSEIVFLPLLIVLSDDCRESFSIKFFWIFNRLRFIDVVILFKIKI